MSKSDKKRVNSIITVTRWDNKLKFAFTGVGDFTFDPDKVSAENRARAMVHGFEQRVRDAAALSVDRDTGKSATPTAKFEAAKRIADHLMSGATEWNLKPATGPKGPDAGTVILAMTRVLKKTVDEIEVILTATQTKRGVDRNGALKVWEESKQVAAEILKIKTERLAKDTDSDALYEEMMKAAEDEESDLDDEDGGEGDEEEEDDENDEEESAS